MEARRKYRDDIASDPRAITTHVYVVSMPADGTRNATSVPWNTVRRVEVVAIRIVERFKDVGMLMTRATRAIRE